MINAESWEHIWYKFHKNIRNITEVTVNCKKNHVWAKCILRGQYQCACRVGQTSAKAVDGVTKLNISHTSAWRILRKSVTLFPYRIQVANILTPADCVKRVAMANAFNQKIGVTHVAQFSMGQW